MKFLHLQTCEVSFAWQWTHRIRNLWSSFMFYVLRWCHPSNHKEEGMYKSSSLVSYVLQGRLILTQGLICINKGTRQNFQPRPDFFILFTVFSLTFQKHKPQHSLVRRLGGPEAFSIISSSVHQFITRIVKNYPLTQKKLHSHSKTLVSLSRCAFLLRSKVILSLRIVKDDFWKEKGRSSTKNTKKKIAKSRAFSSTWWSLYHALKQSKPSSTKQY